MIGKDKLKVLCSISARGGSKGVPGKNIKLLGGNPLITYAIKAALRSKYIDRVVVSTDEDSIAMVAKEYGAEVIIRPDYLAVDRTPLIDSTKYTMTAMDEKGFSADIVVQLTPTCPFINTNQIDKSIEMVSVGKCECAAALTKIDHGHPYRARILMEDGYFKNYESKIDVEARQFHSRQDLPDLYSTTGGLYTRLRHLLDEYTGNDFALGKYRKGIVMNDIQSVDINEMLDFQFAEFLIEKGYADKYLNH
jgi:CMP-N,N'-diacetyllegionaminic acid synthase